MTIDAHPARLLGQAAPWWRPEPGEILVIEESGRLAGRHKLSVAKNDGSEQMITMGGRTALVRGTTRIGGIGDLDRGYDRLGPRLPACGVRLRRPAG